jgi:hypothetical protein
MPAGSRCALILLMGMITGAADLPPMLNLPGTGQDPERIDFRNMPILRGDQSIVSHGNAPWPFRNHAYVTWFDGRFWSMWSHGLRQEDYPSQHVRYSVSTDGRVGPPQWWSCSGNRRSEVFHRVRVGRLRSETAVTAHRP